MSYVIKFSNENDHLPKNESGGYKAIGSHQSDFSIEGHKDRRFQSAMKDHFRGRRDTAKTNNEN